MESKILNILGLARKAGKIVYGEKLIEEIRNKRVYLVIVAKDASLNTIKKITDKANYYQIKYYLISNKKDLSLAIGKENVVSLGISDNNFVNKIENIIKEGDYNG